MTPTEHRVVAVFGGYRYEVGDSVYAMAEEIGRGIAEAGWVLLNGGYGGSMEASARGAKQAGGRVVGVTCDLFSRQPNHYVDEVVPAPDLWARIRIMLERSDAYVALPGATGTLAEVAMAWEMICKEFIAPRPLILLGRFWRPLYEMLIPRPDALAAAGGMVRHVVTPREAVDSLRTFWGK